jgi:hypothetical protein
MKTSIPFSETFCFVNSSYDISQPLSHLVTPTVKQATAGFFTIPRLQSGREYLTLHGVKTGSLAKYKLKWIWKEAIVAY